MDSLCKKSATELAKLIRDGEVASRDVVAAHLDRIDEVNPAINAVTLVLAESALDQADKADHASPELRQRPFHGVPFTIKENIDLVGTPTTQGLAAFADTLPARNAPIVDRMLAAGAIPLGRPIFLKWALAWIPTTPCEVELTTPGIGTSLQEVPAVGRQLPLQRG